MRTLLMLLASLAVMAALVGCSGTGESASPPTPDSAGTLAETTEPENQEEPASDDLGELEQTTVRVSWAEYANNTVPFKLDEFAKEYGLEIEHVIVRSGADINTAIIEGAADAGVLTYTYLFQARDQGVEMMAISGNMRGGTRIVTHPDLELESGDFEGLIALAEERSSAGDPLVLVASSPTINYALGYLSLLENGVDVELFDFQDVLDPGLHAQMLAQGAADIVITGEPASSSAILQGSAEHFHFPYDTALGDMNTEWLATKDWVDSNPNTAKALVRAIEDTVAYLSDNPDENVAAAMEFTGIEEDVAQEAMSNYTPNSQLDVEAAKTAAEFFHEAGLIQGDYSPEEVEKFLLNELSSR